jgi:hypothetical protein
MRLVIRRLTNLMTGTVRRWRWVDRAVAAAGTLVLLTSFLPWYHSGWAVGSTELGSYETNSASVWQASYWWGAAVLLCVAATIIWLGYAAYAARLPRAVRHLRWISPVLAPAGVTIAIWRWRAIGPLDLNGGFGWTASTDDSHAFGDIIRDDLVIHHEVGRDLDVTWGLYAGLAAMSALCLILFLAAASLRGFDDDDG